MRFLNYKDENSKFASICNLRYLQLILRDIAAKFYDIAVRSFTIFLAGKQVTLEGKNKEDNTKTRRDHTFFLNKVFSDAMKRVNDKYRSNISSRLSKAVDAEKVNDLELKDEHIKEAHKLLEEWQTYGRTEKDDINSKFLAMLEADKKKTNQNATSNNYDSQSENSANSQIIQNL